jgi:hypothetical protein
MPDRAPRRLARTLSRARWDEYERLLRHAMRLGYEILSLEHWLERGTPGEQTLILRHDVDQHPRSALHMAAIERRLGLRSTWYFRWRTAEPGVIRALRRDDFAVGLHYETITRTLLERGQTAADVDMDALVAECRELLRRELDAFARRHGPARSACPHGDTRLPGVSNAVLLKGVDVAEFGLRWDGNEAMRGRGLDLWLTDRSAAQGGWRDGMDPLEVLEGRRSPVLVLTHPNNWASGPALWGDRLAARVLPDALPLPRRTRTDVPKI